MVKALERDCTKQWLFWWWRIPFRWRSGSWGSPTGNEVAQSFVDGGLGGEGSCSMYPWGGFGGGGGTR